MLPIKPTFSSGVASQDKEASMRFASSVSVIMPGIAAYPFTLRKKDIDKDREMEDIRRGLLNPGL